MVFIVHFHIETYYWNFNKNNNKAHTIEEIDGDKLCEVILTRKGLRMQVNSTHAVVGISFAWFHCSKQEFFTIVFLSILYQTLILDIHTFILAVYIVALELECYVIQILLMKALVLWLTINASKNVNQSENTVPTRSQLS